MDGFTKRYWVAWLVYSEAHGDAEVAAKRERAIGDVVRADGFEW